MRVTFYTNHSPNNAINKSLSGGTWFDCFHTQPVKVESPEIIVSTQLVDLGSTNYMYIDSFDRYYFIDGYTVLDGGRIAVRGTVDVLYTYRSNITGSIANVIRQQNAHINETPDNLLPLAVEREIQVYRFEEQLNNANFNSTTKCFILTVAGGGNGSNVNNIRSVAPPQPDNEKEVL